MAKGKSIQMSGADVLAALLAQSSERIVKTVSQALLEEARLVMRESLRQVPVKDGPLKASGEVKEPKFSSGVIKVTMGYGGAASAYALYQHNAPAGLRYTKSGSKSHFLSDPLLERAPMIQATLINRIGNIMGRI